MAITINDARYNDMLDDLSQALHVDGQVVVRDEFRLFIKQAIKFLPPKNKAQGEKAIDSDLKYIFPTAEVGFLQHVAETFGTDHVQKWLTNKKGEKYLIDWDRISVNGDGMAEFHQQNRNARGRVTKAGRFTRDIGRWKAHNRLMVSQEAFARYRAKVIAKVGLMKSSLWDAYETVGGNLPNWITRHDFRKWGTVINNLSTPSKPSVGLRAHAPGIASFERVFQNALKARMGAIPRRLKLIASGYGKDVASGIRVASRARRTEAA